MIVTADLHIREDTEETVFGEVLPGLLEAAKVDPHWTLAILGDVYHVRYKVGVRLQNRLLRFLEHADSQGVTVRIVPGNHDQIDARGSNALEVFGSLQAEGVDVFTGAHYDAAGVWFPYRKDPAELFRALAEAPPEVPRVLWTHADVRGALMNTYVRSSDGIDPAALAGWEVYSGHYHKPQDLGAIHYVGSPYQTRADEWGQQKRYGRYDGQTMHWVEVSWGKQYHNLVVGPEVAPEVEHLCRDDELRVTTAPGVDPEQVNADLAAKGFTNVIVTPEQVLDEQRLQVDGRSVMDYARAYVDKFGGDLDRDRLMRVFGEIAHGAD